MGIKIAFNGDVNKITKGKEPGFALMFLTSKMNYWNDFKLMSAKPVLLSTILEDLGYNLNKMTDKSFVEYIRRGYWSEDEADTIDFGIMNDDNHPAIQGENSHFMLNFNCKVKDDEKAADSEKKRCYFWKIYQYHVDVSQITMKGWVEWCNELYQIQHNKPRPKDNRIYINPDMEVATVKGRIWNKDKIEKWLDDHGYRWTQTVVTKYQWPITDENDVILVDSDVEIIAKMQESA